MKLKRFAVIFLFFWFFSFWGFLSFGKEIQIPKGVHIRDSVLYLTDQLGVNIIWSNFDSDSTRRVPMKFSVDDSNLANIIEKYQEANKDIIKITYIKEDNTIICVDKKVESIFEGFLQAKILLDNQHKVYTLLNNKKKGIEINGNARRKSGKESIWDTLLNEWSEKSPPNLTMKELIFNVLKTGNINSCHIPILIPHSKYDEDEKKIIDELKETIRGGTVSGEELNRLKEILKNMESPPLVREENSFRIYFKENLPDEWKEPTYEQIAQFLNHPKKTLGKPPHRHLEFFLRKALEYDSINFLSALIEYKVFDQDPTLVMNVSPTNIMIPDIISKTNNYEAIQFLLKNIEKVKSYKFKETIISCFSSIDQTRLDKECLDIFLSLAKEFKIEKLYLDTSKWIGDDLPDNYDRWQNFKVSEVKLAHEEDFGEFHLKYYKYETPVKIGGIPLKKFEEADYSTPEKAHFSSLCARTYEWKKASCYDNYTKDHFSLLNQWKNWHSGFNPFTEILYKVEVTDIRSNQKQEPIVFLVKKLLNDNNYISNTPMRLDKNNWKSVLSWTRIISDLSERIKEKIAKLESQTEKP